MQDVDKVFMEDMIEDDEMYVMFDGEEEGDLIDIVCAMEHTDLFNDPIYE